MQYNKEFLANLDLQHNKVVYAKITALNINDFPIESIEGKVTGGSINVDGNSAIRRTCSLSIVTNNINISDYLWTLNTKIKIEIGLENTIDKNYPEIIWFNQGIYLITSFSSSLSASAFTINLQGKDKMCRLNGEQGGKFASSIDFGKYETINEDGTITYTQQLLKDIIRDMVHSYGGEPYHNIIINNLEENGLQLMEYKNKEPLFLLRKSDEQEKLYSKATTLGNKICLYKDKSCKLSELPSYDSLVNSLTYKKEPATCFTFAEDGEEIEYCAAKIEQGQVAGYVETDLTYNGDLIANVGETITSILDKIKNMLGNYEYFYNVEGQFVFQKKEIYLSTEWTPIDEEGTITTSLFDQDAFIYNFLGNELITSFNNNPNLNNVKNDFSIWGTRKSVAGGNVPIHMRYAIDTRPTIYTSIDISDDELIDYNKKYGLNVTGQKKKIYISKNSNGFCDYKKYYINSNGQVVENYFNGCITRLELTTYNNYYRGYLGDILEIATKYQYDFNNKRLTIIVDSTRLSDGTPFEFYDWRELIYQMAKDYTKYGHLDDFQQRVARENPDAFPNGITGYEQYYTDLEGFWRQIYNPNPEYQQEFVYTEYDKDKEYYKFNEDYNWCDPAIGISGYDKYYYLVEDTSGKFTPYYDLAFLQSYSNNTYNFITKDGKELKIKRKKTNPLIEEAASYNIYTKESSYSLVSQEEKSTWETDYILLEESNPKELYLITCVGEKSTLESSYGEFYTIKEYDKETSMPPYYTMEPFIEIDEKNTVYSIKQHEARKEGEKYYTIEAVTDFNQVKNSTILYIKEPYNFYSITDFYNNDNPNKKQPAKKNNCITDNKPFYKDKDYYQPLGDFVYSKNSVGEVHNNIQVASYISSLIDNLGAALMPYTIEGTWGMSSLHENDLQEILDDLKLLKACESYLSQKDLDQNVYKTVKKFLQEYNAFLKEAAKELKDVYEGQISSIQYNDFYSVSQFNQMVSTLQFYVSYFLDIIKNIVLPKDNDKPLSSFLSGVRAKTNTYKFNILIDNKTITTYKQLYDEVVKKYCKEEIEKIIFKEGRKWNNDEDKIKDDNWSKNFDVVLNSIEVKPSLTFNEKNNLLSYQKWYYLTDEVCLNESFYNTFKDFEDYINKFKTFFENANAYFSKNEFYVKKHYGVVHNKTNDYLISNNCFYTEPLNFYSMIGNWYLEKSSRQNWNASVYEAPETLDFWFDFLDAKGSLNQFSVKTIGQRPEAKTDTAVTSIYYKEAPQVIFTNSEEKNFSGFNYINVKDIETSTVFNKIIFNETQKVPQLENGPQKSAEAIETCYKNSEKELKEIKNSMLEELDKEKNGTETKAMEYCKSIITIINNLNLSDNSQILMVDSLKSLLSDFKDTYKNYIENKEIDKINTEGTSYKAKLNFDDIELKINSCIKQSLDILDSWYNSVAILKIGAMGFSEKALLDSYDKQYYNYWRYEKFYHNKQVVYAWRGQQDSSLVYNLFSIASQGKSAKETIDELLYTHSHCADSVSISTIPIYYLQPNRRIYIYDENTGIEGQYILNKITIPLTYNGTMTLSAIKDVDRI